MYKMATTRWYDTETTSLEKAIDLLTDTVLDEDKQINISWKNWNSIKVFDENPTLQLNGRDIEYNMIKVTFDQISASGQSTEEIIVRKSIFVIVYYNGISVNYIISQNTSAQKLLRKLLSYTGKNEIEKNVFSFSSDFFVWLISKVYNCDNIIEPNNENLSNLQLESIEGFHGDTEDSQTKVSATGESVMNIISTLSFLLESGRLNQIRLKLSYASHENINLILKKDVVKIDFDSYQGSFEQDNNRDSIIAKLYLLVYLEILPILNQEYHSDLANEIWNKDAYIKFMKNVAKNLTEKIETKTLYLNSIEREN